MMNLSTNRSLYYSSVQGEKNKGSKLLNLSKSTPKSRTRTESESNRASPSPTPQSATKSIRRSARSILPKKFFTPCLLSFPKHRRLGYGQDDDATPVIFYADEDTAVVRKETPYVDPFAFKDKPQPQLLEQKKMKSKVASPTSVFAWGLFTVEEESISDSEEELFFDDPFFPRSLTRVFDENTSIDFSEGVKSINAYGGDEESVVEDYSEPEQWFGFFNKDSFASYEWDPELEDKSFE